jgi:hypothetical protein
MKLKLTLNIGKLDATRLGLEETVEGKTVDVRKEVADELIRKGWALPESGKVDSSKAEPLTSSSQLPADRGAVKPEDVAPEKKTK